MNARAALAVVGLMTTFSTSSAMAQTETFALPAGCTAFLTVQSKACSVEHHFTCEGDPAGHQRRVALNEEGMTYLGTIDAPVFTVNAANQHGGEVPQGGNVSATATSGSIYYTTDGTDPRLEGGGLAPGAMLLSGNINLANSGLVRARARVGGGDSWFD